MSVFFFSSVPDSFYSSSSRTMRIIADLHIHSRYSRACSQEMEVTTLAKWASIKGGNLLGGPRVRSLPAQEKPFQQKVQ